MVKINQKSLFRYLKEEQKKGVKVWGRRKEWGGGGEKEGREGKEEIKEKGSTIKKIF